MSEAWDNWVRFWMQNSQWSHLVQWGLVLFATLLLILLEPLLERRRQRRPIPPPGSDSSDVPPWKRRAVRSVLTVSAASSMLTRVFGFYLVGVALLYALFILLWLGGAPGQFTYGPVSILHVLVVQGLLIWFVSWAVHGIVYFIIDDTDFRDLRTRINGAPLVFTDEPHIPASVGGVFLLLLVTYTVLDYLLKGRAEVLPGILYTLVTLALVAISRRILRRHRVTDSPVL